MPDDSYVIVVQSIETRLSDMSRKLDTIVGDDKCTKYRTRCCDENGKKFSDLYDKYNEILSVCTRIESNQQCSVTKDELVQAKVDAINIAKASDDEYAKKLAESIRTELLKMSFNTALDVVKSNRFTQVLIGLLVVDTVGIYSGRGKDAYDLFGVDGILVFVGIIMLISLVIIIRSKGQRILRMVHL